MLATEFPDVGVVVFAVEVVWRNLVAALRHWRLTEQAAGASVMRLGPCTGVAGLPAGGPK